MSCFISDSELRILVAAAAFPYERLSAPFCLRATDPVRVEERLEQWRRCVDPDGKPVQFDKFLDWQGLSYQDALRVMHDVELDPDATLPAWARLLQQIWSTGWDEPNVLPKAVASKVAFEEFLLCFVRYFRKELSNHNAFDLLTPEAWGRLEQQLLITLGTLASQAIFAEFVSWRSACQEDFSPDSKEHYLAFIRQLTHHPMAFFGQYPVLARLISDTLLRRNEVIREFLDRLKQNSETLASTFNNRQPLGQVVEITFALSDPHRGNRSVIKLVFACGLKLLYKPKDLSTEVGYFNLIRWLNETSDLPKMKAAAVLNRDSFGWTEFLENTECSDEDELRMYYRRAGVLLCLTYALEATDCHSDNLIANGPFPVLVDNECLLHHRVESIKSPERKRTAQYAAFQIQQHSVLRTSLLPDWRIGNDPRHAYDLSGFGGYGNQTTPFKNPIWLHMNTDAMQYGTQPVILAQQANLPRLRGEPVLPDRFHQEIISGFAQAHHHLRSFGTQALDFFDGCSIRVICRDTQIYGQIMKRDREPRSLSSGVLYGINHDLLARAFLLRVQKPFFWQVFEQERAELDRMDIPFFTANVDNDALELANGEKISGYFAAASRLEAQKGLANFNDQDLQQQIRLIQACLLNRIDSSTLDERHQAACSDLPGAPSFTAQAEAIAKLLIDQAILGEDGSMTWLSAHFLPESGRFQIKQLSIGLYDGLAGVALFFAALTRVTGNSAYRLQGLNILANPRESLRRALTFKRYSDMGIASGLGSLFYALTRFGQLANVPELFDEVEEALDLVAHCYAPETKASAELLCGLSGLLPGLLAFHEVRPTSASLALAIQVADQVIAQAESPPGRLIWTTLGDEPQTGLAHGHSGIALAMISLFAHTNESRFAQAALRAMATERDYFDALAGVWTDLRPAVRINGAPPSQSMVSWCNGATGIGMARLLARRITTEDPQLNQELEHAIRQSRPPYPQQWWVSVDHLCCGTMGRVDFLLSAGLWLDRPELVDEARQLGESMLMRIQQGQKLSFSAVHSAGMPCPGMFSGLAGVGYQLLRLSQPNLIPSVLMFQ